LTLAVPLAIPGCPRSARLLLAAAFAPWAGRLVDLRVDRGDAPLADLHRLLDASQDYDGVNNTVDALFGGDAATALASADQGLCAVTVDGRDLLASGGNDETVRLWDPGTGTCTVTVPTHYRAWGAAWVAGSLAIGLDAGILVIKPNSAAYQP
jgi:WD40 repeat protein